MKTHRTMRGRLAGIIGTTALLASLASWGAVGASGATTTVAATAAPAVSAPTAASAIVLTPVVTGLDAPDFVTSSHDRTGRLFIVEQTGKIRVVKNGVLLPRPFLDLSNEISKGGEQGVLGLAFHPKFRTNGFFYVDFTRANGDTVINRYRVSRTNRDVAVRSSARRIITIGQPFANHNGGMIAFGAGGFLYVGMGDGGSGGDPGNRAQNVNSLLGKLLRINVNGSVGRRHYLIPASNPFVGRSGRDEIWSRGLRNPWRFSFDKLTGDLWIGDVGQGRFEEIDRARVTTARTSRGRGVNFGWRQLEGRHCFNPATGCNRTGKMMPVVEYSHADGCAVTGGYVYRGKAVPALSGRYVFGDFCSGKIWAVPARARSPIKRTLLMDTNLSISSFGEDGTGELYVVDRGGAIYKFAAS
jgi:glucose/arabinose dehydrogenase